MTIVVTPIITTNQLTFLQVVNRVLTKLRQDTINTFSGAGDYVKLIGALVNEAVEEVDAAWDWNYERTIFLFTTVENEDTYTLSGSGHELTIESVYNETDASAISGPLANAIKDQGILYNDGYYWDIVGQDINGNVQIRLLNNVDSGKVIKVYARQKQRYLDISEDENTYIKGPIRPIVALAYAKAIAERGEDGGQGYNFAMAEYQKALSDTISRDEKLGHRNTTWFSE